MQDTRLNVYTRTTNPPNTDNADFARVMGDKAGRPVMTINQVRDLHATAFVTVDTGAETALLSGVADTFHDLIQFTMSNESGAVVRMDIRDATAGTVINTVNVPANDNVSVSYPSPYPQHVAAATWTIQNVIGADISGTPVNVSALFIKNL